DIRHGDAVFVLAHPLDIVSRVNEPLFENRKIDSGTAAGEKSLHDVVAAKPNAELIAGKARLGDLKEGFADPVMVADARDVFAEYFGREIFAEHAPRQFHLRKFLPPENVVLRGIRVAGFVLPAVNFEVRLAVAIEIEPAEHDRAK